MKRIISICLTVMCITSLVLGFAACSGGNQIETEETLSDDLDSLMFSLDGVVYTLPVHFSELEANGWVAYDTEPRSGSAYRFATDTLEPGVHAAWELILGNQNTIVAITNLSEELVLVSESYITTVSVLSGQFDAQLVLPGNVTLGSTLEEVLAAFGYPSAGNIFEDHSRALLFYSSEYFILQISINTENDLVVMISLHYLVS